MGTLTGELTAANLWDHIRRQLAADGPKVDELKRQQLSEALAELERIIAEHGEDMPLSLTVVLPPKGE